MSAFSEIIEFLLGLVRDPQARAEFEQDPQGSLDAAGLGDVTAQDVRDARLQLADDGALRPAAHAAEPGRPRGDDDPVREIQHTTAGYEVADEVTGGHYTGHEVTLVDRSLTVVSIDDRDTTTIVDDRDTVIDDRDTVIDDRDTAVDDRDTNIVDSFNSGDDITVVEDSFNSDDDTDVVAIDADNSFNEDNSVDTDVVAIDADNSFNSEAAAADAAGAGGGAGAAEPVAPAPDTTGAATVAPSAGANGAADGDDPLGAAAQDLGGQELADPLDEQPLGASFAEEADSGLAEPGSEPAAELDAASAVG